MNNEDEFLAFKLQFEAELDKRFKDFDVYITKEFDALRSSQSELKNRIDKYSKVNPWLLVGYIISIIPIYYLLILILTQ